MLKSMRKIVLASASPRRKELLEALKIPFLVHQSNYEELFEPLAPEKLALKHAIGKAKDVAKNYKNALIIGVDTVVFAGKKCIGKPKSKSEAKKILKTLSGTRHKVISAICVIDTATGKQKTAISTTYVSMERLTEKEIDAYINSGEGWDKAGGYAIQGLGSLFVKKIEGDYFNVVGMPVHRLYQILKKFGFFLAPKVPKG